MSAEERQRAREIEGALLAHVSGAVGVLTTTLSDDLHEVTPVDTTWAQNNWIPSIGRPRTRPAGYRPSYRDRERGNYAGAQIAAGARERGKTHVRALRILRDVWITNCVPYIQLLNNGHSRQQPNEGWVQRQITATVIAVRRRLAGVRP